MEQPLFDRLGGREGIARIADKVMANHLANPSINTRFEHADQTVEQLAEHAVELFCTGLTGVQTYRGRPMPEAHAGMNITDAEFVSALDDILEALTSEGVGEGEQAQVLWMLYGMRRDIVHQ